MIGAHAMMHLLNSNGFTSIQDIAYFKNISDTKLYRTALERSFTDMNIFLDLRARGELSVRVYPIIPLANWRDYAAKGIRPGSGDDMIHYGALKQFLDGFMMERPFDNTPNYAGGYSFRFVDDKTTRDDIVGADALGWDTAMHLTGDKAHRLVADWYEDAIRTNPPRDRRFRFLHSWYPAPREVARTGAMHAIMDLTPYHLIRELNGMEARLGPERAAFAFSWRTMIQRGVRIDIGSDWPGSYDRNNIAPLDPMENIFYAVTRQTLEGKPAGGFHPEQALTVDDAIAAYTINPAYASRDEASKGSITEGKLADFTVLSRNIRKIPIRDILSTKVRYTILGGKVVYAASADVH